jgi:hypothetical protein
MIGRWTILLIATCGLKDFLENALIGIRSCGIDVGIVQVVLPRNAGAELVPVLTRFGARARFIEDLLGEGVGPFPDQYVEYGSDEFRRLSDLRFPVLRAVLREGNRVTYADLDIAWLRNPLPYLDQVLQQYAWAFQTEPTAMFPPSFCTGFFAVRPDPISFELIELHDKNAEALKSGISNQHLFRELFLDSPERTSFIFPLPEGLFAAGLLFRIMIDVEKVPVRMVDRLNPFIFHANWTIGLQEKMGLLIAANCWWAGERSN